MKRGDSGERIGISSWPVGLLPPPPFPTDLLSFPPVSWSIQWWPCMTLRKEIFRLELGVLSLASPQFFPLLLIILIICISNNDIIIKWVWLWRSWWWWSFRWWWWEECGPGSPSVWPTFPAPEAPTFHHHYCFIFSYVFCMYFVYIFVIFCVYLCNICVYLYIFHCPTFQPLKHNFSSSLFFWITKKFNSSMSRLSFIGPKYLKFTIESLQTN